MRLNPDVSISTPSHPFILLPCHCELRNKISVLLAHLCHHPLPLLLFTHQDILLCFLHYSFIEHIAAKPSMYFDSLFLHQHVLILFRNFLSLNDNYSGLFYHVPMIGTKALLSSSPQLYKNLLGFSSFSFRCSFVQLSHEHEEQLFSCS